MGDHSPAPTEPPTTRSTIVRAPIAEVFAAVSDVNRMGEWSPECFAAPWDRRRGRAGDRRSVRGRHVAAIGPITLERWTTGSGVTAMSPNELFEFVVEGHTTWRCEVAEAPDGTLVTESSATRRISGGSAGSTVRLANRQRSTTVGMERRLDRIKRRPSPTLARGR